MLSRWRRRRPNWSSTGVLLVRRSWTCPTRIASPRRWKRWLTILVGSTLWWPTPALAGSRSRRLSTATPPGTRGHPGDATQRWWLSDQHGLDLGTGRFRYVERVRRGQARRAGHDQGRRLGARRRQRAGQRRGTRLHHDAAAGGQPRPACDRFSGQPACPAADGSPGRGGRARRLVGQRRLLVRDRRLPPGGWRVFGPLRHFAGLFASAASPSLCTRPEKSTGSAKLHSFIALGVETVARCPRGPIH